MTAYHRLSTGRRPTGAFGCWRAPQYRRL